MLRTVLAGASLLLTLAGCVTSQGPRPKEPPSFPPTIPPSEPAPSETPAPPPISVEPPPPTTPAAPPAREIDPAAAPVVSLLARQLRVSPELIEVLQVAYAEWADACLGLAAEGEICAAVVTPGYAVNVSVNGQRYEYRTDLAGTRIRLAWAPRADPGEPLVTWRDAGSFDMLVIGTERVAFGLRGRNLLTAPLALPERALQLETFLARFAAFYGRTLAGEITFRGVGTRPATRIEQQQIATWAGLVSVEAHAGLDVPMLDRALVWRRSGGLAGFCDEVVIGRDGTAAAFSCRTPQERPAAMIVLSPEEVEQLYRWLDTLEPTSWVSDEEGGGATADAFTVELDLDGHGVGVLGQAERNRMLEFINAIVRRLVAATQAG